MNEHPRPIPDPADAAAMPREELFAAFGSFDHNGLDRDELLLRSLSLLDPQKVPGAAEAQRAGDLHAALDSVKRAFRRDGAKLTPTLRTRAEDTSPADEVMKHVFTFYGEQHTLGDEIDWSYNPGTGHWGHDLNRFTFLVTLLEAYESTGDRRYGRKAAELILDWVEKVDTGESFSRKPNVWTSYLNNAIHCEVWANVLPPLLAADLVAPDELLLILKSMHDQLAYLRIVTYPHSGNWPTIGCRGILAVVSTFPELRDTELFATYCRDQLRRQIADQVLPDGVQYELAPHYHAVVVRNLILAAQSLRSLGMDLHADTLATLSRMLHYVRQTLVPSGKREIAFNDSDPEAVHTFHRLLSDPIAQELLPDDTPLGPELFPYAGVAFLRQQEDEGDLYLAFDGGPFGKGHQHEDKLGFVLHAFGKTFILDPGRHLYDWTDASFLPYLRSTRAHSTIMVDGLGQHSRGRPETWIPTTPDSVRWSEEPGPPRLLRATSAYDLGYGDENQLAAVHKREVVFVNERFWIVFDLVEGSGEHLVESRFQFAPGALALNEADGRGHMALGNASCSLVWPAGGPWESARVESGQKEPRGGWYSASYNRIEPAPALVLVARAPLPLFSAVVIVPHPTTEPPPVPVMLDGRALHVGPLKPGGRPLTVAPALI